MQRQGERQMRDDLFHTFSAVGRGFSPSDVYAKSSSRSVRAVLNWVGFCSEVELLSRRCISLT